MMHKNGSERKKAGQVTVYVILGLVLVILIGLALFLKTYLENLDKPPISVQKELQPLNEYVEGCIYLTAKEGVLQMGIQGGYINPQEKGLIPITQFPSTAKAIEFAPESGVTIPYWYYMSSSNECSQCNFKSERPPLQRKYGARSIETQLDTYLESNLATCIQGFEEWTAKGYEVKILNEPAVKTTVAENNVLVELEYPLQITLNQKTYKMSNFRSELDVNLKKSYDIGTTILRSVASQDAFFFESAAIEYITPYAMDERSELPLIGTKVKSGFSAPHYWTLQDTRERVAEILADNYDNIQVQGSGNVRIPIITNPTLNGMYMNNFIAIDPDNALGELGGYTIDFTYLPWWPLYLQIQTPMGKSDAVLGPQVLNTFFPFPLGMQRYDFKYDISFPILVKIHDKDAFNGEGFTLQFAYEANIRGNQPLGIGFEYLETEAGQDSMFCDENQRHSGDITMHTIDIGSRQPVEDVFLTYDCLDQGCPLGVTRMQEGKASLTAKLPLCMGGGLVPFKEGYFGHLRDYATNEGTDGEVTVNLEQFKDVQVEVRKKYIAKGIEYMDNPLGGDKIPVTVWKFYPDNDFAMNIDEHAMLIFTRVPEAGEQEYTAFVDVNITDRKTIKLVSGNYTVEAFMFLELGLGHARQEVKVPPDKDYEEECYDKEPLNPFGGEECVKIDAIKFNTTLFEGGLKLEGKDAVFFTYDDLGNRKITVYIPTIKVDDLQSVKSDLDILGKFHGLYKPHVEQVKPKFSS
ncbi:MAG: hypothetical protein V1743_07140 [Nanoarchaeota archaeon]